MWKFIFVSHLNIPFLYICLYWSLGSLYTWFSKINNIISSEDPVYITFDIDCLDPAFAPGTGTPVVGGLSTAQVLPMIQSLGDLNLIGMDIVEVAPIYDHAEITSLAAATLGYNYLCLLAKKKGAKTEHIGIRLDETPSGSAAG